MPLSASKPPKAPKRAVLAEPEQAVHEAAIALYVRQALDFDKETAAKARAACLALYRQQQRQVEAGELAAIDPRLVDWLRLELAPHLVELTRLMRGPDPMTALEDHAVGGALLSQVVGALPEKERRKRGRARTPAARDFFVACKVRSRVIGGCTVEDACEQVAPEVMLSAPRVKDIYERVKRDCSPEVLTLLTVF